MLLALGKQTVGGLAKTALGLEYARFSRHQVKAASTITSARVSPSQAPTSPAPGQQNPFGTNSPSESPTRPYPPLKTHQPPDMSQCVSCANQPSDTDSLGGAAHEGVVTPMVVGIIVGTVAVFLLVVCALFYCVRLENSRHMAKLGPNGAGAAGCCSDEETGVDVGSSSGGDGGAGDRVSVKPRPSPGMAADTGVAARGMSGGNGGKRGLFGWGRKSGESSVLSYNQLSQADVAT